MTQELRAHYGAPKDAGVLVAGVESESPAAKAGIQVGDIVTRADMSVGGIGLIDGYIGEGLAREMARFQKHIS